MARVLRPVAITIAISKGPIGAYSPRECGARG
jgi:hypothetical protein